MHNECIKGKKGDWYAAEINNEEERKMTKYAFCDYNHKPKKTKIKKKPSASAPAPPKKNLLKKLQYLKRIYPKNLLQPSAPAQPKDEQKRTLDESERKLKRKL